MIALILGTLLSVGALAFVLAPLFSSGRPSARVSAPARKTDARSTAIEALREIEFDRETGKLSEADYRALKASYTRSAIDAMRGEVGAESPEAVPTLAEDAVEAAILAYRSRRLSCDRCGPRPEPDALYCSTCGSYLAGACTTCGVRVDEPGARFCSACGHRLAA